MSSKRASPAKRPAFSFESLVDYTDSEKELGRLELAWADFAAGLRTGVRIRRSATGTSLRTYNMLRLHAHLEDFEKEFCSGDRASLLSALELCCEENVPLPYWAADAVIDVIRQVLTRPVSLHNLFGLNRRKLRASGKRAKADRDDRANGLRLYVLVSPLVRSAANPSGLSVDAAIKKILANNRFPFRQRKAVALYTQQAKKQARYLRVGRNS